MKTIPVKNIRVPASIATCPVCGKNVIVTPTTLALADDGWKLAKDGCFCFCKEYHYNPEDAAQDDYETWSKINKKVLAWINDNFRFSDEILDFQMR